LATSWNSASRSATGRGSRSPSPGDLDEQFAKAQVDVKTLTTRPSNDDLLELYATFKQATAGEAANAKKPGRFDFVGKAKYDAWRS
jgi:acyl-CoA-binding protein